MKSSEGSHQLLTAHARQRHVSNNEVDGGRFTPLQSFFPGASGQDVITGLSQELDHAFAISISKTLLRWCAISSIGVEFTELTRTTSVPSRKTWQLHTTFVICPRPSDSGVKVMSVSQCSPDFFFRRTGPENARC